MKAAQAGAAEYDKRIRRAEHLASLYPFAAEILRFYAHLAEFQKELCARLPREWGNQPLARPGGHLRSELNLVLLLPHFPTLLDVVERAGPVPLADAARQFAARAKSQWIAALGDFWSLGGLPDPELSRGAGGSEGSLTEVLLRAFLQPYCEFLAARMPALAAQATSDRVCPRCGSAPLLGVLRPEGDGAKRLLLCSFCLQEWDFRRILCAACGEEDEKRLPVYVVEQFPHIRVESCDTCNFYLRTVDLTRDGNAVPIVDDLAAIPLSLWALEHGYTRIQDNLLGA